MKINLYTLSLNAWYEDRFKDLKTVMKDIDSFRYLNLSNISFTDQYKTIQMNFGKWSGATFSIARFIKDYPELNIEVIGLPTTINVLNSNLKYLGSDKRYQRNKQYKGFDINRIDIVFIDNYSLCNLKQEHKDLLCVLNSSWNKNQWVIKLG